MSCSAVLLSSLVLPLPEANCNFLFQEKKSDIQKHLSECNHQSKKFEKYRQANASRKDAEQCQYLLENILSLEIQKLLPPTQANVVSGEV